MYGIQNICPHTQKKCWDEGGEPFSDKFLKVISLQMARFYDFTEDNSIYKSMKKQSPHNNNKKKIRLKKIDETEFKRLERQIKGQWKCVAFCVAYGKKFLAHLNLLYIEENVNWTEVNAQ